MSDYLILKDFIPGAKEYIEKLFQEQYHSLQHFIRNTNTTTPLPEWNIIFMVVELAAKYKRRIPEYEDKIASYSSSAYIYARDVINGRWPPGEATILKNLSLTRNYIKNVLRGQPWPEAEDELKSNPESAFWYAINILKRRWPEAESIIRTYWSLWDQYSKIFNLPRKYL